MHGWGMTEMSPVGTYNGAEAGARRPASRGALRVRAKQGRPLFGVDMKIVDDEGRELPWDGKTLGDLLVRGPLDRRAATTGAKATARVDRRRLVPHRRRRHDRPGRLSADHRPREGRDQVRRRVDQLDRAGERRDGASRRRRGRGDRRAGTRAGTSGRCWSWCRSPAASPTRRTLLAVLAGQGREVVDARRRRWSSRAAAHRDRQAAEGPAAPAVRRPLFRAVAAD